MGSATDLDVRPWVLLDLHSGLSDRPAGSHEVPGQPERELFDLPDRRFFCEGEHCVFLSVRGEDVCVVTPKMGGFEVAGQSNADAELSDLVAVVKASDSK